MIQVRVRLYANLRQYQPPDALTDHQPGFLLSLQPGTTLGDMLTRDLAIPRQVVKMMFVNGVSRDDGYVLHDGDEVGIFPPIAGG